MHHVGATGSTSVLAPRRSHRAPTRATPPARGRRLDRRAVLALQRTAGNAAVAGMIGTGGGPPVQRELLAYHADHTEVLPQQGIDFSTSTITFSGEAARVTPALQSHIDAGKVLATDDGKRVFYANLASAHADLVIAFTTAGLPKPVELTDAVLSKHNVFVFSGTKVHRISTLFGSTTLGTDRDVVDRTTSRLPTHFERTEAAKVFRGSVDLDRVRIEEDPLMTIGGANGIARTTPTTVNMPPGSLNRSDIMPWLIHEFTHSWQYQHGVSVATTLIEAIRARYDYGGPDQLANDRKLGKRFVDYTTEQQGDICSDFYERTIGGADVTAYLPFIEEVRDPTNAPAPPSRSPVLDLNDRLLLEAKLPLRRVEAHLGVANACPGQAGTDLRAEAAGVRATVERIQARINGFPGGNSEAIERRILTSDVNAAAILAERLEDRKKSSCADGTTACVPVDPSVVVAVLGGAGAPAGAVAGEPVGVQAAALQRVVASRSDLEGLRHGDGLRPGSTELRPQVQLLQEALNEAGADLGADGMFGDRTGSALMDFQAQRGLTARQQVDEVTAELLADPAPDQVIVTSSTFVGLQRGDGLVVGTFERRPRVTALQERLTALGAACTPDGMFGPLTQAALNQFQASRGLPPTDVVDPLTADALDGRTANLEQPVACPVGEVPVLV